MVQRQKTQFLREVSPREGRVDGQPEVEPEPPSIPVGVGERAFGLSDETTDRPSWLVTPTEATADYDGRRNRLDQVSDEPLKRLAAIRVPLASIRCTSLG